MATRIPLPGTSLDALMKGVSTGSTMYSNLMNPIINRENMANTKKIHDEQLAQQWKTHLDDLALRKAADARNASLMPYRLQELKDRHAAAQFDRNMMSQLMDAESSGGDMTGGMGGGSMHGTLQPQMPTEETGQGLGVFTPEGMQQAQQALSMPSPQYGGNQALGANNPLLHKLMQNPMMRGWFKHKFGLDPLAPAPQTPEEKQAGAINQAVSIDEAIATRKKLDEIEKTAQALLPYLGKVNTIEDILKRKPDLAGRTTQLADLLGMTKDEDVGTFLSAAQALQAHMAKEMSSRGGYGVSKLVEQAKPNIGKSRSYNVGVIKDLKQSMKESFEQMKSEYERLSNGKKFPYNFDQYFKEVTGSETNYAQGGMVPMISPKGKRVMIPSDKVDAALAAGGKHA